MKLCPPWTTEMKEGIQERKMGQKTGKVKKKMVLVEQEVPRAEMKCKILSVAFYGKERGDERS